MTKLNILLTISLFIVTSMLITVLLSKDSEAGGVVELKCNSAVRIGIMNYMRCDSKESICYLYEKGIGCFKK